MLGMLRILMIDVKRVMVVVSDCKSAHVSVRRFESFSAHHFLFEKAASSDVAFLCLGGRVV